jgi:hypothetical protein
MIIIKYVIVNPNFRNGPLGHRESDIIEIHFHDNVACQKWMMEIINDVQPETHIKILEVLHK